MNVFSSCGVVVSLTRHSAISLQCPKTFDSSTSIQHKMKRKMESTLCTVQLGDGEAEARLEPLGPEGSLSVPASYGREQARSALTSSLPLTDDRLHRQ